jgi:hypothetical protein
LNENFIKISKLIGLFGLLLIWIYNEECVNNKIII